MSVLEDVLVPVYLYHRYQLEAVTKIVGGMYYTYAIRGDGQQVTKAVSREEQLRALNAVVNCLEPDKLVLPQTLLNIIPPRPAGYDNSRELFKKRTGLAFDALTPAETAADLPFSFLFNGERLTRMIQYEAGSNGLSLNDMIKLLIEKTWKAPRKPGMQKLVQFQTEQVLLTYLLAAGIDQQSSVQARAVVQMKIKELKNYINAQLKTNKDEAYTAHLEMALERMKAPEKATPTIHSPIPPGAPIGCEDMDW
jgi:uncharacterized protein DUF4953